jgi:hypothetical protein
MDENKFIKYGNALKREGKEAYFCKFDLGSEHTFI